ncbi:MAG TPA: hypothetical protein VF035_01260 [Longimicrobiales bacterium]
MIRRDGDAGTGLPLRVVRNGGKARDQDLNRDDGRRKQPEHAVTPEMDHGRCTSA